MAISMYAASVPVFIKNLENLATVLRMAAEQAATRKIEPSMLIGMRLAPDMLPLARQVQIASDNAKGPAARLAGVERPAYEDNEATFDELQARIAKTIEFLKTIKPEQIDGSEDREVSFPVRGEDRKFRGEAYLLHFALPNFFFHVVTAYAILRHAGIQVGKLDYLGELRLA